jgi:mannose-1-phosphate guanylyltransferase / phosphomannomutase
MAGGEGTRLRPLTSNQPKPMVPIVGRPCMEHIVELLRSHGFDEIMVTVAFMPQAIRSYFGDGDGHGVSIKYSVEETPAGTAGSVRLAADELDDTFLVISGDALCDVDLGSLVRFHQEQGPSATIGLVSVENPLEFGIVVTDDDGRVERFLEKPSWGQVFSDTINTGIYVLEPEVLRHVPTDRPYDFSKELFPLLLEMGRPLYGAVLDGYWQDIGDLDQYRQANFDALDERVRLGVPGVRLRGNVWLGEGVEVDDLEQIQGPAFLGNYCRVAAGAAVGPYAVLSNGVNLREGAEVTRSVIDAQTYLGRSVLVEGAVIGRSCDIRSHARVREGAAIGDECTLRHESVVMPGVRIYPFKEVEAGTTVDRNVIWESRASGAGTAVMSGLVNVDLTPETAIRLGMAIGTALKRGSRVVASRAQQPACRLIKRSLIAGISSTGVHVDDLRVLPAAVNRHLLKSIGLDAGVHVRPGDSDPEVVQIQLFEPSGVAASPELEREIAKHFSRQEFRRASYEDLGEFSYPSRAVESYVNDLLSTVDVKAIRDRRFRIVVDYGYSSASLILPLVLGALEVETFGSHAHLTGMPPAVTAGEMQETLAQAARLVAAVGADFGAVLDQAAERILLVDDRGEPVSTEEELLLFVSLMSGNGGSGTLAFPVTTSSLVEDLVSGTELTIQRTQASVSALTRAAAEEGTIFAGASFGGFVFPSFLPAYDAMASLTNLLRLLARVDEPVSSLVARLPRSTLVHREVRCPWALKGTLMRVLTERMKGRQTDLLDGIKVFEDAGWAQIVPDPDEPIVHIYAEGDTPEEAERLEQELQALVEEVLAAESEAAGIA